ncbi:RCC1 domain-containing protein 1 isoform X2 [Myripristis murdjan]|uniref:RCC1 domain-containing protein 1 isoform X2 n=1 Tax=Myripristis murdjan TaxID=586833 RepID=UPI00117631E9|nr:RCC1 domain-containing protein 1 isoform X2 [Myripristis murdjan]
MNWFGFGFNAFGQIAAHDKLIKREGSAAEEVKVVIPTDIGRHVDECEGGTGCKVNIYRKNSRIKASWSRRASLHSEGDGCLCVTSAGFGAGVSGVSVLEESRGCRDALICERHLTLAFPDRTELWSLEQNDKTLIWSMEIKPEAETTGPPLKLPLVPGGYVATKLPFYRSLSPQLRAVSLALGAEHAVLLSATGAVYTWGLGSHGQLGHGGLTSEEEPRAVEALWGMPMSCVATGGWHSACISAGGDLYMWGWNESGQLGLPSQTLRKEQQRRNKQPVNRDASSSACKEQQEGEKQEEVFISIQAFPALLDIPESCEFSTVSCGSRHTAAVTTTGDLYTWGWGEYGQLGHRTLLSSDEPQCVDFFKEKGVCVVDVVCGAWNTFAAVAKEEVVQS